MSDFKAKMHLSAGALPQTPLEELTALPQTGFEGPTSKEGEGKGEGMRGEGREVKGGERRPFW